MRVAGVTIPIPDVEAFTRLGFFEVSMHQTKQLDPTDCLRVGIRPMLRVVDEYRRTTQASDGPGLD